MAVNRVLTSDEREILLTSTRFQNQASWALRDFASFWSNASDANTKVGQVGYEQWAKNWIWSSRILNTPSSIQNIGVYLDFVILSKGMLLWDSAVSPFNVDTVINYMIANGK